MGRSKRFPQIIQEHENKDFRVYGKVKNDFQKFPNPIGWYFKNLSQNKRISPNFHFQTRIALKERDTFCQEKHPKKEAARSTKCRIRQPKQPTTGLQNRVLVKTVHVLCPEHESKDFGVYGKVQNESQKYSNPIKRCFKMLPKNSIDSEPFCLCSRTSPDPQFHVNRVRRPSISTKSCFPETEVQYISFQLHLGGHLAYKTEPGALRKDIPNKNCFLPAVA